jgi:hypothetical protein
LLDTKLKIAYLLSKKYGYQFGEEIMSSGSIIICGQQFSDKVLQQIQNLINRDDSMTRAELARQVCDLVGWYRANGQRKDMSCRVALLKLHRQGLLSLPPATKVISRNKAIDHSLSLPELAITKSVEQIEGLSLVLVTRHGSPLWKIMIQRYHYLGYTPLVGAQLRYVIDSDQGYLGAIGFSASAWKVAPRDQFIGWSGNARQGNLPYVICNSRFLILPWVHSKNLASKILSLSAKRVVADWYHVYGYRPVLLETYVEQQRFLGTCYRAANWIKVGKTQGRGKLDRYHERSVPVKDIYLYPLRPDFRELLCRERGLS